MTSCIIYPKIKKVIGTNFLRGVKVSIPDNIEGDETLKNCSINVQMLPTENF